MMKVVTQKGTRSGRMERTINIRCSSLQEFSHSPAGGEFKVRKRRRKRRERMCVCACILPGSGVFSGSAEVNHWCQSRGYCSNELAIPMKLASLVREQVHTSGVQ